MNVQGAILTLNTGSSSLKFALFDGGAEPQVLLRGAVEGLAEAPSLSARDPAGAVVAEDHWSASPSGDMEPVVDRLLRLSASHLGGGRIGAVGHRVVHGGSSHVEPALVTAPLLDALAALTPLDPVHMPATLRALHAVAASDAGLAQVVCFDTAFHATQPDVATRMAIPRALSEAGARRYGFHGLSYEYISGRLKIEAPALAAGRTVVAHLGSGDSLCAMQGGRSVATTTGFSTLDGLVMATRCGTLDPGVIFYLARKGRCLDDIEQMLFERSGLLGVSGVSGDVQILLASRDPHAREALDLFTYRIACETGAMATAMGGIDGLVFTAGVGQHAPKIRAEVCRRLSWLGVELDEEANLRGEAYISTTDSRVAVRVMATDEEAMIARHTRTTLDATPRSDQS